MAAAREQFSSEASPELLSGIREIARSEGRPFQEAREDAMRADIASQYGVYRFFSRVPRRETESVLC